VEEEEEEEGVSVLALFRYRRNGAATVVVVVAEVAEVRTGAIWARVGARKRKRGHEQKQWWRWR
jgi:hypothetical protein